MLVLDVGGDGKISDAREFVFTEWDKSATGDLEAVRNVFDTNGNGRLDAGDARWSEFKVLVDGTLVTLDLARHRLDRPDAEGQRAELRRWLGDSRHHDLHADGRIDRDGR
ncbi:hypothetical protein U8C35_07150 [Sinorhizobium medicae]|uniref:hypothetical protein n=1 Tax=Sinorhizobium medicae TaxID=110321 RepID=UPI002AF6BFDE|nr:hypothetical protein [Sinorhizobium medicae]WQO60200.1 hypothetical protein U8C35_07150 [Sinorhizobium medicae]